MPLAAFRSFFRPKGAEAAKGYAALIAMARSPDWYLAGGVADTLEGRFRLLASLTALVIVRLERGSDAAARHSAALTEAFIADMEAQLRESGVSDPGIGKRVRRLVGSLANRATRWRAAIDGHTPRREVIAALLYDEAPAERDLAHAEQRLAAFETVLFGADDAAIIEGRYA